MPERSAQPKDLINLRNTKNGEVYRFACRTCIDGHRAPLCDPKKHNNKIMYRRPNPGRPARQCGHPKNVQCDCLSKRTLCCALEPEEWEQVQAGFIVTVKMYETIHELEWDFDPDRTSTQCNDSSSKNSPGSQPMTSGLSEHSAPQPKTLPYVGPGTPDRIKSMASPILPPFPATMDGCIKHMAQSPPVAIDSLSPGSSFGQEPIFQAMPQPARDTNMNPNPSPFSSWQVKMERCKARERNDSTTYAPTNSFSNEYISPAAHLGNNSLIPVDIHTMRNMSISLELSQLNPEMRGAYLQSLQDGLIKPQDIGLPIATHLTPESLNAHAANMTPMPTLESRPKPNIRPTGSCCSQRAPAPAVPPGLGMASMNHHSFPSSQFPFQAPRQQFPCPMCASMECTCDNCPSTMQSFDMGGAWSQACGREGHLQDFGAATSSFLDMAATSPPTAASATANSVVFDAASTGDSMCVGLIPAGLQNPPPPMAVNGSWGVVDYGDVGGMPELVSGVTRAGHALNNGGYVAGGTVDPSFLQHGAGGEGWMRQ